MNARMGPERVLVAVLGLLLFTYGATGLVFSGAEFGGNPIDGTTDGETWLGAEGNGWTFISFMTSGVLLLAASAARATAKTAAVVFGLLLGALAVIALVDGDDVLGTLAANGWTALVWGVAAWMLLAIGLAPGRPRYPATATPMDETPHAETRFDRSSSRDRVGGHFR
jgi:hypothetical protein